MCVCVYKYLSVWIPSHCLVGDSPPCIVTSKLRLQDEKEREEIFFEGFAYYIKRSLENSRICHVVKSSLNYVGLDESRDGPWPPLITDFARTGALISACEQHATLSCPSKGSDKIQSKHKTRFCLPTQLRTHTPSPVFQPFSHKPPLKHWGESRIKRSPPGTWNTRSYPCSLGCINGMITVSRLNMNNH